MTHKNSGPWAEQELTVQTFVCHATMLGIPAFQRGSVWPSSGVEKLLESLASGFFVGTLLIWRPRVLPPGAVALCGGVAPGWLLLDGQQRARALLAALFPFAASPRRTITGGLWCVRFGKNGALVFSRRYFHSKSQENNDLPLVLLPSVQACWPHGTLLPPYEPQRWDYGQDRRLSEPPVDLSSVAAWQTHFSKNVNQVPALDVAVARLTGARLDVRLLTETEIAWSEPQVIENYRRINSTGSTLSSDELEFARLVAIAGQKVSEALAATLQNRPGGSNDTEVETPNDSDDAVSIESRDELLNRGDEREFGLSTLIRAVKRARDAYDCAQLETGRVLEPTRDPNDAGAGQRWRDQVPHWVAAAGEATIALASAFKALGCDARPRIPRRRDVFGWLLGVLARFPALREQTAWAQAQVQMLLLGFYLRPGFVQPSSCDAPDIVILNAISAKDAVDRLRNWLDAQIGGDGGPFLVRRVTADLNYQSRYVDLLYWYLRACNAVDIVNAQTGRPADGDRLCGNMAPERQHIVPFTRVQFETPGNSVRRSSQHLVNAIGNLTWISHHSNGFAGGWSNEFMRVTQNSVQAHLLQDYKPEWQTSEFQGNLPEQIVKEFSETRAARVASALFGWWRLVRDASVNAKYAAQAEPPHAARRSANPLDMFSAWGYSPELARTATRIVELTAYGYGSRAVHWSTSTRYRIRYTEKNSMRLWDPTRPSLEFELRGPGETQSRNGHLRFDRERLAVPAPLCSPASPLQFDLTHDAGRAAADAQLREMLRGWLQAT